MQGEDRTEALLAQNAALALSLNWMRRQVETVREEGGLPPGLLDEGARRDVQQERIDAQAREIRALTERIEAREAPAFLARAAAEEERDALRAYAAELERHHLAMLRSTSWRLTGPLRWVLRRMRGLDAPDFAPRYLDDREDGR